MDPVVIETTWSINDLANAEEFIMWQSARYRAKEAQIKRERRVSE